MHYFTIIKYTDNLIFLVIVGLIVVTTIVATTVGLGDMHLGVDLIVTLYVRVLTGESNTPVGIGLILATGLGLAIIVVVIILNLPVKVIVRDVGVINILFAVASVG